MATNYPAGFDAFPEPGATLLSSEHDDMHANVQDAVEAIEGELGTNPSGASATVRARFEDIEGDVATLNDAKGEDSGYYDFLWTAGWTTSLSRARKYGALVGAGPGVVVVTISLTRSGSSLSGAATTPATIPAGFRPSSVELAFFDITDPANSQAVATVGTNGVITFSALTINTGGAMFGRGSWIVAS
jgi:hypothetical protein